MTDLATGLTDFGYLFPDLQEDSDALLPRSLDTLQALDKLGAEMKYDTGAGTRLNSTIPSAYTYFGQFVDHDIVLEAQSNEIARLASPTLEPLLLQQVLQEIKNTRSATLDLDSVYRHPALRTSTGDRFRLGEVVAFRRPAPRDPFHDLFRQGRASEEPQFDRAALIGDPRNDENLILAQLHVAFLRAHNALIDQGMSFEAARTALRRHYQWIVLHDFLPRIADPDIVRQTIAENRFYRPTEKSFFLPLEFTAAAFRFGHSMVRGFYRHNRLFPRATLAQLFTFTALSGNFNPPQDPDVTQEPIPREGFNSLPAIWIIDWSGFVDGPALKNYARKIDTGLVEPLSELRDGADATGRILADEPRLAVRNLRRGYLLRMPTGQAVARRVGLPLLTPQQIQDKKVTTAQQSRVLERANFLERTPLWFYILAEASALAEGNRLGPVGSTIVAEVLVGLVRRSADSILAGSGDWKPHLPRVRDNDFDLPDLLRLAGVLPPVQPPAPAG